MLTIRTEQTSDYAKVYQVITEAFKTAEHSDGNEGDLVENLRKSSSFIPQLSLVASVDGRIVGHILFTKAYVNKTTVLALAPLSVLPEYQNQGIGQALIKQGHKIAKKLGYQYSVVLGHAKYYPKAGYIPASQYSIKAPFEIPDENFMAICFDKQDSQLNGILKYDNAFGIWFLFRTQKLKINIKTFFTLQKHPEDLTRFELTQYIEK